MYSRKEVIQPQVLLRLPCYDFTPVADSTVGGSQFSIPTSSEINSHGVTGGEYKTRERIHRSMADLRLLAIPTSWSRVADSNPDLDVLCEIRSSSHSRFPLYTPLQHVCSPTRKGHDDLTSSPPSSGLSPAVSFEFPTESLATKDKGCARCGT